MKALRALLATTLLLAAGLTAAGTPCETLKSDIAAKIDAKGVKDYSLEVVANDAVGDQKVVGSCEGGSKKIVYKRGDAAKT
jgi:outer membrane lipoprotein-sorting protein